jgi:uncharacterized protein (TIGR03000 family)
MLHKALMLGGTLLLAAALVLLAPGPATGRPPSGGGHGGGGHGGGGHRGGVAVGYRGGYHAGYRSGVAVGYRSGYAGVYRGGYYGAYRGGYYAAYRPYHRYGYYRPYYGYRAYYYGYPWWWGSGLLGLSYYSPTYYYVPDYYYGDIPDILPYSGEVAPLPSSVDPLPAPASAPAQILVNVPINARVYFNGSNAPSAGTARQFTTPALPLGSQYSYDVQASWEENGRPVTQTQRVLVSGGSTARVTFPINTVSSR